MVKHLLDKEKLRKQRRAFQAEVVDKMSALATAAFGLVAALAWNSAIQAIFARAYPNPGEAIWGLLGYASLVTLVAVAVILVIGRIAGRLKKEALEDEQKDAAAGSAG